MFCAAPAEKSNLVALVGRDWNQLVVELGNWDKLGREVETAGFAVVNSASRD